MWTGLTHLTGVTVELGKPGMIGVPGVVTVPGLPGVVGGTEHRVPGPGVTGHVQNTLVGWLVTAEQTLS